MTMVVATAPGPKRQVQRDSRTNLVIVLLLACCFVTLALNFLHAVVLHGHVGMSFPGQALMVTPPGVAPKERTNPSSSQVMDRSLAGLNCDAFGGPSPEVAQEMVYWSDISSDEHFGSPFHRRDVTQYMTFEPDGGGWNNIRMSMETNIAMALASGRTLVLPPEQRMYLLTQGGESNGSSQKKEFSFQDFFCFDCIVNEHKGVQIVSMETFLATEGLEGRLRDQTTGQVSFPPQNRTTWNGMSKEIKSELNPYLRSVALMPDWVPEQCLAAFPSSNATSDIDELERLQAIVLQKEPDYQNYVGHPVAVDGSALDRMKEMWAARQELCIYDATMQAAPLIHFHGTKKLGARLLVHFYAFLFFQDWWTDLWMKRFVRDHVRYLDELQCAAARIVQAVRQRARERGTSSEGEFDAFHIRRGDFQYKKTRIEADEIYSITNDVIPDRATVYIGTDERKKEFFDPLRKHWDVVFLDDFLHLVQDLNTNYYGMLDQLVTSRGRTFIGCWFSTFTGYINRLRGYHSDRQRLPGYEDGVIESYYYAMPQMKYVMKEYVPVKKLFYAREYPASWRGIDKGIGEFDGLDTAR